MLKCNNNSCCFFKFIVNLSWVKFFVWLSVFINVFWKKEGFWISSLIANKLCHLFNFLSVYQSTLDSYHIIVYRKE